MSFYKLLPFLLFAKLLAEPTMGSTPREIATTEGEPSSYIEGMVSAITGDLYLPVNDLTVRGVQPIPINRIYMRRNKEKRGRWAFFDYLKARSYTDDKYIVVKERNGSKIVYELKSNEDGVKRYRLYKEGEGAGLTNCGRGKISGQTYYGNNEINRYPYHQSEALTLKLSDGSRRIYHKRRHKKFRLVKEIHTNGNSTHYDYENGKIKRIFTKSPSGRITYAWVDIENDNRGITFKTSDGRILYYDYSKQKLKKEQKRKVLHAVRNPEKPDEHLKYAYKRSYLDLSLSERRFPNGELLQFKYYQRGENYLPNGRFHNIHKKKGRHYWRVREIWTPTGKRGGVQRTHHIKYDLPVKSQPFGVTNVYDIGKVCKKYYWSKDNELLRIEHDVDPHGRSKVQEVLSWTKKYKEHVPFLAAKTICDEQNKPLISHEYIYNERGNVRFEKIRGNLSGTNQKPLRLTKKDAAPIDNGCECHTIERRYDNRDLLFYEEESNLVKLWGYHYSLNLLTSFSIREKNTTNGYLRKYRYNHESILIEEVEEEAFPKARINERRIRRITPHSQGVATNFPHIVDELYYDFKTSEERLLSRAIYTYKDNLLIDTISYYDADENHIYTKNHKYDKKDRLIQTNDALGRLHIITYDENNRIKTEKKPNEAFETHYTYNAAGKVVKTEQNVDGRTLRTQTYTYDRKNRPKTFTDHRGNTTETHYDHLDNPICTIYPDQSHSTKKYNALGEVIEETDPEGNTIYKKTNARGQVTHIRHPDGAEERFIYNLNGTLKTAITPIGTKIHTTYDYQKRPLTVRTEDSAGNTLSEEIYTYNAFHLLSKKDPDGVLTEYTYDPAGRLLSETTHESPTKSIALSYAYDARGRVMTKTHTSTYGPTRVYQIRYDDADRIIEEREEDDQGRIYSLTTYAYDDFDNKISITRDKSLTTHKYDPFKRLIQTTDPLNNITIIAYHDHKESTITTTDPLGRRTIQTKDAFDNLIKLEKYSPNHDLLLTETYLYDKNHNLIQQTSHLPTKEAPVIKTWNYDTRNRVRQITHPDATTTSYTYTLDGHQETLTKPSGVVLTSTYDALGHETSLISSDGTVHYTYTHDDLGRIITAIDQLTQQTTTRDYDHYGNLLEETLANGLRLCSTYDCYGRKLTLTYPDGTLTTYVYDAYHLLSVQRNDLLHTFDRYDLNHNLLQETLMNRESITYTPDLNNKLIGLHSSFQSQTLLLDPVNNVRSSTITFPQAITNTYTYDDLDQLTSESGLFNNTYIHDAHHNRLSKNNLSYKHSPNNELEVSPESTFSYLHGNRLSKDDTLYTYDALDRLISIQTPLATYTFSYDAFHRRLTRTHQNETLSYLYDDQNDIGLYHQSLPIELRILGQGYGAEIGATILIESQNRLSIPRHDLFGNIIALQNLTSGKISHPQYYNPFGQTLYPFTHNGWGFQSKRHEHDLIYFGRRYYDPSSATWLTPDPKGYEEGPNLYQYLLNNPLLGLDLYGLTAEQRDKMRILSNNLRYELNLNGRREKNPVSSDLNSYRKQHGLPLLPENLERPILVSTGIKTTAERTREHAEYLSQLAGGYNIHFVNNPTHGIIPDLIESKLGLNLTITRTSLEIVKKWTELTIRGGENTKLLHFFHSQSGIDGFNAGMEVIKNDKEHILDHINAVAIAPARYIPDGMFNKQFNYISKDFVPHLQEVVGKVDLWYRVTKLTKAPGASVWDHDFQSPTYKRVLEANISRHISSNL